MEQEFIDILLKSYKDVSLEEAKESYSKELEGAIFFTNQVFEKERLECAVERFSTFKEFCEWYYEE